jgi:putative PIN family toxin of toxin-antitoxin system
MGAQKVVRVVIDTNVVVSALLFGGIPGQLIPLWKTGTIKPLASAAVMDEYIRVMTYPKFKLSEDEIHYLLHFEILPYFDAITVGSSSYPIIDKDPSDDKFILCAVGGRASVIISGDRHLLAQKKYKKIEILTPERFLKTL